ncbi:MRC1-like domain-containing protein [Trametes polyzona]|nr:MRC1-like domain-containing protein [Trametes polyzona]
MSRSPSPVVRRATRTYGRRRVQSDPDTSFDAANTSIDSHEDSYSSTSLTVDHELPPSSDFDASNTSPPSKHAGDLSDDGHESDDGPSTYQYGWRKKLKEMDADDFEAGEGAGAQMPDVDQGKASVPTRPASPVDQAAKEAFSGTLTSLPSSAQSSSLIINSRPPRRVSAAHTSEPESDVELRPSTPQTSPRHPINTPQTQSSPTPPTSIEMPPKKGKGKQRETNPLPFESADDLASGPKTVARKPQKTSKAPAASKRTKAPTKKERLEMEKATARISAQQSISIQPVQAKQYGLSTLLQKLNPAVAQATAQSRSRSRSQTPPIPSTSDPILPFSSPAPDTRDHRPVASSSKGAAPAEFIATGLLGHGVPSGDDSDSSVYLPDSKELLEESQRKRNLQELKARALAAKQQGASGSAGDDSDDELVIEDDPKNTVRDVAQSRRALQNKGYHPSLARKMVLSLARPTRRAVEPSAIDKNEARHVLEVAAMPTFLAPQTKAGDKQPHLDNTTLNKLLLIQNDRQRQDMIREKEEEWKRRGGRLKEQPEGHVPARNPQEYLQHIAEKRRAAERRAEDAEMVHGSDSDGEYRPEGYNSEEENDENAENAPPSPPRGDLGEQADDEDDDNPFVAPRPRRSYAPRLKAAVLSDEEEDIENQPPPPNRVLVANCSPRPPRSPDPADRMEGGSRSVAHRSSVSSFGDRTEDDTDKENDALLSFDRGEDKENTVIAVQSPGLSLRSSRGFGSLFAAELEASPAARSAADGVRSPLKELPADEEEDPFMFSPGPLRLSGSTPAPPARPDSPMDLSLGGGGLQAAFTPSAKGKEREREPSPSLLAEALPIGGSGGFSQFFTQEGGGGFEKLKAAQRDDDIALTAEPGLQPALEVDQSLAQKADQIFEKEQELAVQAQQEQSRVEPTRQMFVDENGFLTQTRPELRTPLSMMTPSQPVPNLHLSSPSTLLSSVRKPLAPLLTQDPDDDDDDDDVPRGRLGRLRKRDRSPTPDQPLVHLPRPKNAFELLERRPTSPKGKKPVRSAFVEGEAEESDEDAAFGFGGKRDDDDEEEEDDDAQDQPLPDLVDDKEMDEKTLAEDLILEKHREQIEEDDKRIEKVARNVATGQVRIKRRDRGIGFDGDSDSESDDDSGRPRPQKKKPRLNNSLAALAKHDETKPFAEEYNANMVDDDNEFAHMNRDDMELDIPEPAEDEEPQEVVSMAALREEMQRAAREQEHRKAFNPEDVSWVEANEDSGDESDAGMRVREVTPDEKAKRPARTTDRDEPARKGDTVGKADLARLNTWVKSETSSRTAAVVGRSTGGSAAVTGHVKPKVGSGGGSFKGSRASASSSTAGNGKSGSKLAKAPSVLSAVSSRRNKFAN